VVITREVRVATPDDAQMLGSHYLLVAGGSYKTPTAEMMCKSVMDAIYSGNAWVVEHGEHCGSICARWLQGYNRPTVELHSLWMDRGMPRRMVHRFMLEVCEGLRNKGAEQFLLEEAATHMPYRKVFKAVSTIRIADASELLGALKART